MSGNGSNQHPNSLANLKPPFSKTNQPKNRGRKPSSIKKYIKENNINYNDVSAMAKYIIPLTQAQIGDLVKDEKAPFMMRLFARAVLQDMKKGYMDNILKLLDRAVGKPKESLEVSGGMDNLNTNINVGDLTPDQAKQMFLDKINGTGEE